MIKTLDNENVFYGKDSLTNLTKIMESESASNILLISSNKSFKTTGLESKLQILLKDKTLTIVNNFEINPKYEEIIQIGDEIKYKKIDLIIAAGGGSVIDFAKCMNVYLSSWTSDGLDGIIDKTLLPSNFLPMVAVPTTSGTGSEATHFAVVYIKGTKTSVSHKLLTPTYAIIDPSFTYGSPPYLSACCAFDALCQAIESFWSIGSTPDSQKYAKDAILLIKNNIVKAINSDYVESRDKLSEGAYLAGKAINISKTTAPHALSYSLTSTFSIPHGHAVALTLGYFFEINELNDSQVKVSESIHLDELKNNILEIKSLLGWSDKNFLIEWKELMTECGLYTSIQIDHEPKMFLKNLINSVNIERLSNHPVQIEFESISDIYSKVLCYKPAYQ